MVERLIFFDEYSERLSNISSLHRDDGVVNSYKLIKEKIALKILLTAYVIKKLDKKVDILLKYDNTSFF